MSRVCSQETIIFIGVLILCMSFLPTGCKKPISGEPETIVPLDTLQLPLRGFFMGLLPIPAQGQSFEDAYLQASQYSEFVPVWGKPSPFYNLANDLKGEWGQFFVQDLVRNRGMFPIIHLSFFGSGLSLVIPPGIENASLSDVTWRSEYKKAVLDVIKTVRPVYLSIGNEVNRWYEKYGLEGPNGFYYFISLYEEIYDEAKKLCPEIKLFCIFAREIVSENREADLEVLHLFNPDKMDLLIFTSYPYSLGITNPLLIPDDYYSRILEYMPGKAFGFSEVAWTSLKEFGGEQSQAEFITQLVNRLTKERGINLYMLGWPWLHDLNENDTIGLIKIDGTEKLAYTVWKDISEQ